MATKSVPDLRYDMPAVFGPSLLPAVSHVPDIQAVVISFQTSAAAAEKLLPRYFRLSSEPIVSFSRMTYRGVDYMGGRGYTELVVSVNAVYDGPDGIIHGPYMPVLWVSDVAAILAGREFMGYAKIHGELAEVTETPGAAAFECREYGTLLVRGEASDLVSLSTSQLDRVRAATADAPALGWKYIPGIDGAVDADYPTLIVNRWNYRQAWSGTGHLQLFTPAAGEAPYSSRIMATLASLPMLGYRRAFVGVGSCDIDRAATRRLAVT